MRSDPRTYQLDLDIGEVVDGHHLIVRSISLTAEYLVFDWEYLPEVPDVPDGPWVWPEISYGADVSPPGWNAASGGCGDTEWYERPVPGARYAYFDFFRPDYNWMRRIDRHGQPDSEYLRNRIARLTFDVKTGESVVDDGTTSRTVYPVVSVSRSRRPGTGRRQLSRMRSGRASTLWSPCPAGPGSLRGVCAAGLVVAASGGPRRVPVVQRFRALGRRL